MPHVDRQRKLSLFSTTRILKVLKDLVLIYKARTGFVELNSRERHNNNART